MGHVIVTRATYNLSVPVNKLYFEIEVFQPIASLFLRSPHPCHRCTCTLSIESRIERTTEWSTKRSLGMVKLKAPSLNPLLHEINVNCENVYLIAGLEANAYSGQVLT